MNVPNINNPTAEQVSIALELSSIASIDSTNRGVARRFIRSLGFTAAVTDRLTIAQLNTALGHSEAEAVADYVALLTDAKAETETKAETKAETEAETKAETASAPAAVNVTDDAAAQLGAALAALMPKQGIDAEAVRRIVREEAGLQPIRVTIAEPMKADKDMGLQHRNFPTLLKMIGAGVNVWLTGPAGTGKTTAAENVAKALDLPFSFNGAIDSEHKLLGFTDAQGRVVSRPFREAFVNGGVYLFDEVDASLPSAVLAFNAALANGHCDFPDGNFKRHENFRCIAAANTWGSGATHDYVGRAKMDAAFVDRFVSLSWENDEALERTLALSFIADQQLGGKWVSFVQGVRAKIAKAGVKHVVSPRASINGAKLLQAGLSWDEVAATAVRKGLPEGTWAQVAA